MKRITAALCLCALTLGMLGGCAGSGETAYVESVSLITGTGSVGLADRYAGKVVAGQTEEVERDTDKTILETYVEEGDTVEAGDLLFSYDMEAMQLSLDKLYLEKESYENTITAAESEISELETQKAKASSSDQLSYTLQISSKEADIREAEYNIALKEREIAAMEADMENTDVTASISGRVMSITEEGSSDSYYSDSTSSGATYITIMDVTTLRVEGNINEMNASALTEGMAVTIRSRVDESQTWSGTITYIDWENPVTSDNDSYYYIYSDDMTTSSKYPFYIELEDTEGLLLGQHVYIEPDTGDGEGSTGLMLPSYYITGGADNAYVWAANDKDKLEKRSVTLGSYDADTDCYEILSGLDTSDYIAFPDDSLSEGMAVEKYDEDSFSDEEEAVVSVG